ncbi:MAG TPA: nuclear transport factor 2 family protein [Cyclobacteriaceae bacterium]|jgi:ketosteroid isomerase-like protein|nr:nuclear transport factor 2 family protein [Cytophagales bacterium]HRE68426.1 nuclear transport factor 2 family protein [Cyclobacteriaceae bacterium]HRF31873.1 nuclear transport factor 2 family protein [Cyclobacteriaceae bacterium]
MKGSALIFVIVLNSLAIHAQAQNDSLAVKLSIEKFFVAFNSFQWEPFRESFTDDATIFFPDWEQASRKSGINEIERTWLELFPEFRDSTSTLKLNIVPRNIKLQLYDDTAVVTFHLGNGEKYVARRTLVMVKIEKRWKIAHLHASILFPQK